MPSGTSVAIPNRSFFRVPEAAAILEVAVPTIYMWVREGRMEALRLGELVRIPKAEIERALTEGISPKKQR